MHIYVYIKNLSHIPKLLFTLTKRQNVSNLLTAGVNMIVEHLVLVLNCFKMCAALRIRNIYFQNFNNKQMQNFQKVSSYQVEMLHKHTAPTHRRHFNLQQQ